MEREAALRTVSEWTSSQWGLLTARQARSLGVDQVTLVRLREAHLIEKVGHGVYLMTGAAIPSHLDIKVAWLRLDPKRGAWQRTKLDTVGAVVSHRSACLVHEIGDIPTPNIELTVPARRTTRESNVKLHIAEFQNEDFAFVDGLPVTTIERTIVDLLKSRADGGHIGGVISAAEQRGMLDVERLAEKVPRYGYAYGMPRATGMELIRHLVHQAGGKLQDERVIAQVTNKIVAAALPRETLEAFQHAVAIASRMRQQRPTGTANGPKTDNTAEQGDQEPRPSRNSQTKKE